MIYSTLNKIIIIRGFGLYNGVSKNYVSLSSKSPTNKQKSLRNRVHQLEKTQISQDDIKMVMKMLFEQQNNINKIQTKLDEVDITNKALTELIDYFIDQSQRT